MRRQSQQIHITSPPARPSARPPMRSPAAGEHPRVHVGSKWSADGGRDSSLKISLTLSHTHTHVVMENVALPSELKQTCAVTFQTADKTQEENARKTTIQYVSRCKYVMTERIGPFPARSFDPDAFTLPIRCYAVFALRFVSCTDFQSALISLANH